MNIGSAASTPYTGPELLIDRDLVLVTINYRLGKFLSYLSFIFLIDINV